MMSLLCRPPAVNSYLRCFSSALYIAGDKASETYAILTPHVDFEKRFREMDKLKQNIAVRKLEIDPAKLESSWGMLKTLEQTKSQLDKRRQEIADKVQQLRKTEYERQLMDKLKIEGKIVRDDLKAMVKVIWEVEEQVMSEGLLLPNDIHPETPQKMKLVYQFGEKYNSEQKLTHVEIGEKLKILDMRDNAWVYYLGTASVFDLALTTFFAEEWLRNGYVQFSNPDVVRSIIVEGCGRKHEDPEISFTLAENERVDNYKLHLVGGGSIYPFCAFHTKLKVDQSTLPLRYFTTGRQYRPAGSNLSLFKTWQSSVGEVFILTHSDDLLFLEFKQLIQLVITFYKALGFHFRVVYVPVEELCVWESMAASFQMYSYYEQRYVEVGRVTYSGDYMSQRLLMTCEGNSGVGFLKMVSATVFDFPKILGCVLESEDVINKGLAIPECLKQFTSGYDDI